MGQHKLRRKESLTRLDSADQANTTTTRERWSLWMSGLLFPLSRSTTVNPEFSTTTSSRISTRLSTTYNAIRTSRLVEERTMLRTVGYTTTSERDSILI